MKCSVIFYKMLNMNVMRKECKTKCKDDWSKKTSKMFHFRGEGVCRN